MIIDINARYFPDLNKDWSTLSGILLKRRSFFYLLIFANWDTSHDVFLGPMHNFGEQKLEKFYMWKLTTSF